MRPEMPSFLRRRKLLFEARRRLLDGAPDEAFDLLQDPVLVDSDEARALGERVNGILCREAARLGDEGARERAVSYWERVAGSDPELAGKWRARVLGGSSAKELASRSRISVALSGALQELRSGAVGAATQGAAAFRLVLDDLGEFIVPLGDAFTLGDAREGRADLGVVADLVAVHARFCWSESFHGGHQWRVFGAGGAGLCVGGLEVGPEGAVLEACSGLELSPQVRIAIESLGEGSSSVVVAFRGGVECEGTSRLLLFGRGAAGAIHLGRAGAAGFGVGRLEQPLSLELGEDSTLRVSSADVLRFGGEASIDGLERESLTIHLPPERSVDLLVGSSRGGSPPYGVMVAPLRRGAGRIERGDTLG